MSVDRKESLPDGLGSDNLRQENSDQSSSFDPYKAAIARLTALKAKNKLSEADVNLITRASSVEDVLQEVQTAQLRNESERKAIDRFVIRISKPLVLRLERFGKALDIMTQSTKTAALLWGSLRFMIAVCTVAASSSPFYSSVLIYFSD